MRTVLKYNVPQDNTLTVISLPRGAKILYGDCQQAINRIWAEVDDAEPVEDVNVIFLGTGREVPNGARHVNSFMVYDGMLVFHLYEVP